MGRLPVRARVLVVLVCWLGALSAAVLARYADLNGLRRDLPACVALALLVSAGELRPVVVTRRDTADEITLSTGFALALALVAGTWPAVLVMCAAVVVQDVRAGKAGVKVAFNAAQYAVGLAAAGAVFALLSRQSLVTAPVPLRMPRDLLPALAAGAAFFVLNTATSVAVAALASGDRVLARLLADLRFQLATSGLLLTFAPVLAVSLQTTLWLLPLLVLPLVAIYVSTMAATRREAEALRDPLTGLANRTLFGLRVDRLAGEGDGPSRLAAVMMLDVDHFREINDTLGHAVGDRLIVAVARRLEDALRDGDTVARLGGDEFALLALDLGSPEEALAVAERLLDALTRPFDVDGVQLQVEASVGVALYPEHGRGSDLLMRAADVALYDAKVERACARLHAPARERHTLQRLALAADLRTGLERHELLLHHQPKVDLRTGRVVGFEALVRWQHPELGLLMPDDFLPLVENTGLIGPMTLEVLDQALRALTGWRAAGHDLTVAVNLSARHLTDLSLPDQVAGCLAAHGLPGDVLELEVTETLVMTDPVRAQRVLGGLRRLGVTLAVDDFGTGYSSLAYLRRLDVDELKIDKSFVLPLGSSDGDAVIVRSTIDLGHNLGLRLVAEGVEDGETLALLRDWGCDLAQGYFLSRPLPEPAVLAWLASWDTRAARALLVPPEPALPGLG